MDTFMPLVPPSGAFQCIAGAQDTLIRAGRGIPGPAYLAAFHGAKHDEPLSDLLPQQAAELICTLTGADEHTQALLAYGLRGLGLKLMPAEGDELPPSAQSMTERERQVLAGIRRGMSNKQIAIENGIAEATVKLHVKQVLRKLGAANRTQAALKAVIPGARI